MLIFLCVCIICLHANVLNWTDLKLSWLEIHKAQSICNTRWCQSCMLYFLTQSLTATQARCPSTQRGHYFLSKVCCCSDFHLISTFCYCATKGNQTHHACLQCSSLVSGVGDVGHILDETNSEHEGLGCRWLFVQILLKWVVSIELFYRFWLSQNLPNPES